MIDFPILRMRMEVQLRELTMREAISLAAMPPARHEAATDRLLSYVVASVRGDGAVSDPRAWTVQERMMAVAHYIACTADGGGNFEIGEGHFLDYLDAAADRVHDEVDVGEACGDQWRMRQLSGAEALAIESVCATRIEWIHADMAARLYSNSEHGSARPDPMTRAGDYAVWLQERREVFRDLPESDFEALFAAYERGRSALHHLFWVGFDDAGLVVLPKTEGGTGVELRPARFPVASTVGRLARWLGTGHGGAGELP